MTNNYNFLDAYTSVKTAAAIDVAGALQPVVNIAGSVITVGTPAANQSVSGTVNIADSSIAVLQSTSPWLVTGSVASAQYGLAPGIYRTSIVSTVPTSVSGVGIFNVNNTGNGSVLAVIPGSVAVAPTPHSVSGVGTFNINNVGNGSVITVWKDSSVLAGLVSTNASVITVSTGGTTGNSSVYLVGYGPANVAQSSGTTGTDSATIVAFNSLGGGLNGGPLPIAPYVFNGNNWDRVRGNSVIGMLVNTGASSVIATLTNSSVAALQGTNPWIVQLTSGSVIATVNTGNSSVQVLGGNAMIGSIAAYQGVSPWVTTSPNTSIVGTYAEDSASTDGDKGLFTLAVRNDNVSSFVSANTDYTPVAVDSAGRTITKPFAASEALVQGVGSTVNIGKASLLGLSGTGLRNYVTDILVANTGSVATFVTFTDSDASIIGRTIAPATSGSNIHLATPMRTGSLNSQVEFTAITAVSILSVSAYGYKAP